MTLIKELDVEKCNGSDQDVLKPVTNSNFKLNTNFVRSVIEKYKNFSFIGKTLKSDDSPAIVKSPKSQTKISTKITPEMGDVIRSYIEEDCLLTMEEINSKLDSHYNIRYDLERIAGCLHSFHYSVGRVPDLTPSNIVVKYIPVIRQLFARRLKPLAHEPDLYFLGCTKLNINTRVHHGKKVSPRWSIKSKTFTICVAMQADGLFMYEAEEDPSPFSSSPNVSPASSPEVKKEPYKFIEFFKKFLIRMGQKNAKKFYCVIDGSKLNELREDPFMDSISNKIFVCYPGESTFFSPTELFFDQMRSHIAKFNPATPQDVFSAVKNIPSVIDEVDCSLYFDDIMNYVNVWSSMDFEYALKNMSSLK